MIVDVSSWGYYTIGMRCLAFWLCISDTPHAML